jgi:transcriptional regulator with GAF, ATPase, and Fis domain
MGRAIQPLSDRDIRRLKSYNWPGNVRELQNVVERAVITSQGGRLNLDRALPEADKDISAISTGSAEEQTERIRTIQEIEELERQNLIRALEATNWRVSGENGAARLLGINSSTLSSRMKALGIKRPR